MRAAMAISPTVHLLHQWNRSFMVVARQSVLRLRVKERLDMRQLGECSATVVTFAVTEVTHNLFYHRFGLVHPHRSVKGLVHLTIGSE